MPNEPAALPEGAASDPAPFIKWVGGKRQILAALKRALPRRLKKEPFVYLEPFVGGGAVFFALLKDCPMLRRAVINDINPHLIAAYRIIRDRPEDLIAGLNKFEERFARLETMEESKALYLEIRTRFNAGAADDLEDALLLCTLNRTCFNGLYRESVHGKFNVPFGQKLHPKICNAATIRADSEHLKRIELTILHGDFTATFNERDRTGLNFFYLDPPYRPLSLTSSFTTYAGQDFAEDEQERLARFCAELTATGNCLWLQSNSDPRPLNPGDDFYARAYPDCRLRKVMAHRHINSDGRRRGPLPELLIANYER